MLTAQTLVGIACLVANKGPIDTANIELQLNQKEKVVVASIIQSGACLPQNLEKLILETQDKIQRGELKHMASSTQPTDGCF